MNGLNLSSRLVQWLTLAFLAITWGSSFILMKRGLLYFSSDQLAAIRMTIATAVLLPVAIRNVSELKRHWKFLLLTGLFGNALPYFLFALAQTEISSSLSGMLNSLTSLFTLTIGVVFFRARTNRLQVLGVLVALVGAAGLIGFENLSQLGTQGRFALLVVIATVMYGFAVNVIKYKLHDMRSMHITSLAFMLTGPFCAAYLFTATDFTETMLLHPEAWAGIGYIAILAVMGTAIAVIVFNMLIKHTTAVMASSVTYLIPVVAIGWGLVDAEPFGLLMFLYMSLVLAGIFLIHFGKT